nr:hypothetical protein [Tanacetum cinerariifolium]
SSSKGTSCSQQKSSGKSAHAKEPRHTAEDSGVRQNQEFHTGNNDKQPDDEAAPKGDCTLNSVWTALRDISLRIRIDYLSKRKWSRLNKQMARVMIHDINKQLFQIRLIRNLEKFIGGREYGEDLRLLEWKI